MAGNPTMVFTVDWADTGVQIPYNAAGRFLASDYDWEHGSQLNDLYSMIDLQGYFEVQDPDSQLDPATLEVGTPERIRLEKPHRMWGYSLHGEATDSTDRITGWAVIDRRPNNLKARFRLLSLDFVRLSRHIPLPQMNVDHLTDPPPVKDRYNTGAYDPTHPNILSVTRQSFSTYADGNTYANVDVSLRNLPVGINTPYYVQIDNGYQLTNLSFVAAGDSNGNATSSIGILTVPGLGTRMYASVFADLSYVTTTTWKTPISCP